MLKARELWGLVNGKDVKLNGQKVVTLLVYIKRENRAFNLIVQHLSNSQLLTMKKETIAKGIWEALQNRYVDKGLINRLFLTRKFFTLHMNPIDTREQHLNKLRAMAKSWMQLVQQFFLR